MRKRIVENYVIFTNKDKELVLLAPKMHPVVIASYGEDDDGHPFIRNDRQQVIQLGHPAPKSDWVKPLDRNSETIESLRKLGLLPKNFGK